jgi:hypothetical protein
MILLPAILSPGQNKINASVRRGAGKATADYQSTPPLSFGRGGASGKFAEISIAY